MWHRHSCLSLFSLSERAFPSPSRESTAARRSQPQKLDDFVSQRPHGGPTFSNSPCLNPLFWE